MPKGPALLESLKQRARELKREAHALYLAARHPQTPWYAKVLAAGIAAYALSPIDLIPDFVPILGYLDDLILIPAGIALAVRLIPESVLAECRQAATTGKGRIGNTARRETVPHERTTTQSGGTMAEPGVIQLTQRIAYPPARVWAALTTPALLERWWARGNVKPEVGHQFGLDMGGFGEQSCEVVEVEPDRLFAYTFGEGSLNTRIRWTLEADGDATQLTLEHSGFNMNSEMGQRAFQGMSGGWPQLLPRIEDVLRSAEPDAT